MFVAVRDPGWLWAARLGQGAAASAFSPAASVMVTRLNPQAKHGRASGSYGFFKSIGYTAGPLLGGVLVWTGGLTPLFCVLMVLAAAVVVWAALMVPAVPPLPKARQILLGLARRLADGVFLRPVAALAAATAALSVGVGFLPLSGAADGLSPLATGVAVSALAACAAFVQPWAGRALDDGRLTVRSGTAAGLLLTACGLAAALLSGVAGLLAAAVLIGIGTGLITPLGFAALAATTPEEWMGQTMGAAELGRELGDAGGPLLVASIASITALTWGYAALALLIGILPLALRVRRTPRRRTPLGRQTATAASTGGRGTHSAWWPCRAPLRVVRPVGLQCPVGRAGASPSPGAVGAGPSVDGGGVPYAGGRSAQPSGCGASASGPGAEGSPAASLKAVSAPTRAVRRAGARRATIVVSSRRRRAVTCSTVRRPSSVSRSRVSRRLPGLTCRSARPETISRSTMRIAVGGDTRNSSASLTSLVAPRVDSTTSIRNCARVTRSSTSASEFAATATSTRDAVTTARVTASTSSTSEEWVVSEVSEVSVVSVVLEVSTRASTASTSAVPGSPWGMPHFYRFHRSLPLHRSGVVSPRGRGRVSHR